MLVFCLLLFTCYIRGLFKQNKLCYYVNQTELCLPQSLYCQLNVVSLFGSRKILELCEARVSHQLIVTTFAETPACLDLRDGPHLVDVLRQLVADVLDEGSKLNLL